MFRRLIPAAVLLAGGLVMSCGTASAQSAPSSYTTFTAGAQSQPGLFPIWHKGNRVYLEMQKSQLDQDFMETITTGSGTGLGLEWGDNDYLPTELIRFERHGDTIAMVWPNWYAMSRGNVEAQLGIESNLPNSVIGTGAIAAEDDQHVIFDASSMIGDQLDLRNFVNDGLPPGGQYRLDPSLSYFGETKAFPDNDVIDVDQTWVTDAEHVIDTAPDARRVQIKVVYNLTQLPQDDYKPRLADDRVGIYDAIYLDFSHDNVRTRHLPYLIRWNFDPADPTRPSPARHPMVIYLSNTVPPQYRGAIRDACLAWNKTYAKIGILDAVQVKQQPNDPNWDPDDVRYNVIRWLTEARPSFGADSNTLFDPRTGEEFRVGVLVSGEVGNNAINTWKTTVDPVRYGRTTDPIPAKFVYDAMFSTLLHEMGHNMGLQHNFIGSMAYTAKQLQSQSFTRQNGITTSAMEYAPLNLWPQPYGQGEYYQTVPGPYDYYAIKYGYAHIPGANTPEQEVPTLRKWATAWSNPLYRYASDEDVAWGDGHAADPRSEQGDLTNDPLAWCQVQLKMYRDLANKLNSREPQLGSSYEDETRIFTGLVGRMANCAAMPAHWIGGQYLSRAHRGDPGAVAPIIPVSLADEQRAFTMLDQNLYSDDAWNFPATLLNRLGYAEWAGYGYVGWPGYGNLQTWAYNPPPRHDFPLVERINAAQMGTINFFFQPLVLQRIDENPTEATGPTMTIGDLFGWLQHSIYGDLHKRGLHSIPLVTRNLQLDYAQKLIDVANAPARGTPSDAQALAHLELVNLRGEALDALHNNLDLVTQAHLSDLVRRMDTALKP